MTEPEVSVPAVMRNYHEVLRNDLSKVLAPLAEASDLTGFGAAWRAYCDAIAVHAAMEDGVAGAGGGITTLLDLRFDGAVNAGLFRAEHGDEHAMQAAVTRAIAQGSAALQTAWETYRACAEAHLLHEEDIMMPLVARLPPSERRALFAEWCVSAGIAQGGFDHFVAHGVASLATFGSTKNSPTGATRVFVHALKTVCTHEQWARYGPIAYRAAPTEVWEAVLAEVPSLAIACPITIPPLPPQETTMSLRINDIAPNFTAETTQGTISFHDWIGDSWACLFSHPKDFTPVCTTELGYMARIEPEFTKRNTKLIGLSADPVARHGEWAQDIQETQGAAVNYPMIGDSDLAVAKLYNMLPADEVGADSRTAANNATVRSVFIIGPDKKIKLMLTYPMTTGRNFDEILRVLDSMQLTAKHKVATPVNWQPGDDVIIAGSVSDEDAKAMFPAGWKAPKPYLRITKQPS